MNQYLTLLALVRTPSGATRKGVIQLEATFYSCEKAVSPPGHEPGSRWRYMFFTSIKKVASSWRTPLRVVPEGVQNQGLQCQILFYSSKHVCCGSLAVLNSLVS